MWASSNQLKTLERLSFPEKEEGILPQDCNQETLPEFSTCWLDLQNLDAQLHLNSQLPTGPTDFKLASLSWQVEPIF